MLTLALIGVVGGLITGISPCILPVLPVIFFSGGAQSARNPDGTEGEAAPVKEASRWRPYQVVAGLVLSFSIFTLLGSLILNLLGLPQDVLRWAALIVLVLIGLGLIFEPLQHLLERPFARFPQRAISPKRRGFGLGLALGAVYVPCAGPILAAITVAGSTGKIGWETVVLTVSFAVGTSIPLLFFALAGRRVAERVKAFRTRQKAIRITGGVLMIALAIGLVFNVPQALQRLIPDYTAGLQDGFNNSEQVKSLDLGGLVTDENKDLSKCSNGSDVLQSCGPAPALRGIDQWFNTADDKPIALSDLRGKVVLVDFWAYSCINCLRSVPHVSAWAKAYQDAGLTVIGVHSPEYAFEKVPENVAAAIKEQGITYPVALDNQLSTWTAYRNRYWPAHYLIDASGTVRQIQFGEGGYATTEKLIRELLTQTTPDVKLPAMTETADDTPKAGSTTPETYLSPTKMVNFGGTEPYSIGTSTFAFPEKLAKDTFALDGSWTLTSQGISSTEGSIKLAYTAQQIRMVLGGSGTVTVTDKNGTKTIPVSGPPGSYEIFSSKKSDTGELKVTVGAGVDAYSFTFG
ncbi:cytochrome c biogenesis protein DipZ [Mycetocola lacteus]|uniref:Cytochrome c biogenesis protein DipZ n=1 Tax=Mycetocola lacteus TaxID=76637 RepID=A0A3L7AN09_9MICO|nr:cytochrome c biogenesis protein DipZ [Mycetocola lacteus]RLP80858.1 cytochrome c biogenesis protein DipZ [Mycetocola lacteus]RLP84643.1 cytochrome c biogenesis protein DipZ [Mycetocola lacteus]